MPTPPVDLSVLHGASLFFLALYATIFAASVAAAGHLTNLALTATILPITAPNPLDHRGPGHSALPAEHAAADVHQEQPWP